MKPIHRAIVFLQQARDIIDQEAHHTDPMELSTGTKDCTRRDDLNDVSDALGEALYNLEAMDGTP